MSDNWISTEELISFLKAHPNEEKECRLYLDNHLGSTHYWYWDSAARCLRHTRDWPFYTISEHNAIETYSNCQWRIEQ